MMELLVFILIGAIAGFIAGKLVEGDDFGLGGNILLGIVGALVGGYLLGVFGLDFGGFIGQIVTATIGAALVLALIRVFRRA